jgi:hypothetical protein
MFQFLMGVAFGAAGYWAWQSFGRDLLGMSGDQDTTYGGFSGGTSNTSFGSSSSGSGNSTPSTGSGSSSPSTGSGNATPSDSTKTSTGGSS